MKAKVIDTGEIVNVTPYPTLYKENGQGPDRREWDEDELEFIVNPNKPKMVKLEKIIEYLTPRLEADLGYYAACDFINNLRKEFE